jgi:hypothetical protein
MIPSSKPLVKGPDWDSDFPRRSPMFAPLRALAEKLPALGWPNTEVLNHVAVQTGRRIVNARGQRIWFVPAGTPRAHSAFGFEPRTFATGEVEVRPVNWHDLFNVLVWIAFPTVKASINGRHCQALEAERGKRSPTRDALTHFDEDGVIVLCADASLSAMLREFRWKELFWNRREDVRRAMRFVVFGHALYEKALAPFVGMTGKALIFDVTREALELEGEPARAQIDRLAALHVWNPERMLSPRELAPLPVLGVPGWWDANAQREFYDNTDYFRPGRRR